MRTLWVGRRWFERILSTCVEIAKISARLLLAHITDPQNFVSIAARRVGRRLPPSSSLLYGCLLPSAGAATLSQLRCYAKKEKERKERKKNGMRPCGNVWLEVSLYQPCAFHGVSL